jgi:N-acetylneuraminic acid mutarotase
MSRSHYLLPAAILAVLAACSDTTTEPETLAPATASAPDFAVASNSWSTRADMPTERLGLATAVVPNSAGQSILYAIGGTTLTGGSLSKVQAYNVATNSWTTKAPLPVPLYFTNGAGVIRGKLYISGGLTSYNNYRSSLYVYNPSTNSWTRKRDMPNTTFRGVTGVINNQLYVLTGCDQDGCNAYEPVVLYRYNPATDQWARLAKPTRTHDWGMGGVIGGKFYVTGGSTQLDVYDPATNRWTIRAPLPQERWLGGGAISAGKLYIIGGYQRNPDGTTTPGVRTTSVYDPGTNRWTTKASAPKALSQIAASRVVLNGQERIEVVGGRRPGNNLAYIP